MPTIDASQLVVGLTDSWSQTNVTLIRFTRTSGRWHPVGSPWPAVLGYAGLAWGRGTHGDGPPPGETGPRKNEGDGASPAGVFALSGALGYEPRAPSGGLPFTRVDGGWRCVNDVTSFHYNRIFDGRGVDRDWAEAELMRRSDDLYRSVVVVDHNNTQIASQPRRDAPKLGGGSCIFLHVWDGPDSQTIGCTAMTQERMDELIDWLEPARNPHLALMPRAAYERLAQRLGLPAPSTIQAADNRPGRNSAAR